MLCVDTFDTSDLAEEQEISNFFDEGNVADIFGSFNEDIKEAETSDESCSSSLRTSFCEPSVLLITNHPHNKTVRPSPRRFYPFRGISTQTSR